MLSRDGQTALVFNGEIYGYKKIRSALDYPFRTQSDTEVILALYQKHGLDLLPHLPGMFAFGLWDESRRRLFCARDRFGEKPFYYAWGPGGEFVFASEIKAILASGLVEPKIAPESVAHYLQKSYIHVERTIYSNIHTLPPGHALVWEKGGIRIWRYWHLTAVRQDAITLEEATEEFWRLFDRAVERQLVADVPVGVFLSGGLDSGAIVCAAAARHPDIKVFTHVYGEGVSELAKARSIADRCGVKLVETHDHSMDHVGGLFMQAQLDEPSVSGDAAFLLLCKEMRKHCKAALIGLGGDELLGGYTFWYARLLLLESKYRKIKIHFTALYYMARMVEKAGFLCKRLEPFTHHYGWRMNYSSIVEAHRAQGNFFSDRELASMGLPLPSRDQLNWPDTTESALRIDTLNYMPGACLSSTDRVSMLTSLEVRAPFLDVDLAEFCLSLPTDLKVDLNYSKKVLRQSLKDRLPSEVVWGKKQGFGNPVDKRFAMPGVRDLAREVLSEASNPLYGYIPKKAAMKILDDWSDQAWILLALSLWLKRHARLI